MNGIAELFAGEHNHQQIFLSFEKLKPKYNLVPRYQISN